MEELLKAFSHTQLIIIQRSDAKVTVCDPTASGAIGGRTDGNAGARLLPNEATDDSLRDRVGVEQPARVDVASTRGSSKSIIHPARAPGTGERVPQVVQKDERSDAEPSAQENSDKRIRKKYIPINVNVLGDITGRETVQLAAVGDTEFVYYVADSPKEELTPEEVLSGPDR